MQTRSETPDVTDPETLQGQLDPMDAPVPGQSLTTEPKNANYESSAESVDPEQVIQSIIAFVSQPEQKDMFLSNMAAGMPVESIVQTFALAGVAEGKFSPDVAEIIKPALAIFFIKMAMDEGIPVIPFTDEVASPEEQERQLKEDSLSSMRGARPEFYKSIKGQEFKKGLENRAMEAQRTVAARREIDQRIEDSPVESDGSFIEMEGV